MFLLNKLLVNILTIHRTTSVITVHDITSITSSNFNTKVASLVLAYKLQNNFPTLNPTPYSYI